MKLKKICTLVCTMVMCIGVLGGCSTATDSSKIRIGIVQHMEHPALEASKEGFLEYFKSKGYDETKIEFIVKNAQGDTATDDMIATQFANDNVDLVFAIATPAAQSAYKATKDKKIPVVFTAVTDAKEAGIVLSNEKPGENVTGVSDAAPLEQQLKLIRTLLPNAKKIGMIYNTGEVNGKLQVEQVQKLAPSLGFEVVVQGVAASTEITSAAEQLTGKVDCIYNITDNLIVNGTATIVDKANNKNIPVFAAEDGQMAAGLLASDSLSYKKLGEQAGAQAFEILINKKNPGEMPVETAKETSLYINKKVAEKFKITIPDELAKRATFSDAK
ncbi:MAG: ABC transporter substrate-binding protein [Erysipelotrichaceae bacterium]